MSVTMHGLRLEASLLSTRIEAAETIARHCYSLAASALSLSVACHARAQAREAERLSARLALRLSRITQDLRFDIG